MSEDRTIETDPKPKNRVRAGEADIGSYFMPVSEAFKKAIVD